MKPSRRRRIPNGLRGHGDRSGHRRCGDEILLEPDRKSREESGEKRAAARAVRGRAGGEQRRQDEDEAGVARPKGDRLRREDDEEKRGRGGPARAGRETREKEDEDGGERDDGDLDGALDGERGAEDAKRLREEPRRPRWVQAPEVAVRRLAREDPRRRAERVALVVRAS